MIFIARYYPLWVGLGWSKVQTHPLEIRHITFRTALRLNWTGLHQVLNCDPPDLATSALSPQTWPFSLQWLPESACLVGGTVRDALLGRHSDYLDLDFVLPEGAVETARAIARHYRAGFVLLDVERQIARVVFAQGTADFALQVGPTLEADLQRRDFTVNAIAYNPHREQLLDPLQGYADLQRRLIRMVSADNLAEDPLRLLRAYRQAAQLGFSLEPNSQHVIRQLAPRLRQIAAERVQSELGYLLSTPKGTPWLMTAWEDQLLQDWCPDATASHLSLIAAIDQAAVVLQETWPAFGVELLQRIRSGAQGSRGGQESLPQTALDPKASGSSRTWLTTAKLACLLSLLPERAEAQLWRLKYSRVEIQAVTTLLRFWPQVRSTARLMEMSAAEQYYLFQGIGPVFPALVVLVAASGVPLEAIAPLIERFLTPGDPIAHPSPLVTGQELMQRLHLPPGPRIGQLLAAIQLARAEGKIATPADALALAENMLD